MQGAEVVIPAGWNLIVDVPTPKLGALWIDGGNVTIPRTGGMIYTGYLIIRAGGRLAAGSREEPMQGDTFILLHGTRQSEVKAWTEDIVMGSKVVAVLEGELALHGVPRTRSVPLAADAAAGSSKLVLPSAPTGWQVRAAAARGERRRDEGRFPRD